MSFFGRLFRQSKSTIQCPRCLGKGHVDQDDIKRLNQELKWAPGVCAYCNGKGKVNSAILDKVAVDTTYLTIDLPKEERQRIVDNDREALERGRMRTNQVNNIIHGIIYLHYIGNLEADKIAEFYLLNYAAELHESGDYEKEKEAIIDYVHRVITLKRNSGLN